MYSCPIWNQSVIPCPVLTIASWPTYRFLKTQVRWSGVPISLSIFHSMNTYSLTYWKLLMGISSIQFSHSIVSESLWPHEWQHTRPPCPSPTPGVHWDSRPSSHWCHPAISSSVVPFSSCPQSLPAPESFPMSQLFANPFYSPSYMQALETTQYTIS